MFNGKILSLPVLISIFGAPPKIFFRPKIFFALTFGAMGSDTQLTPMMAQYRRIKGELPNDALLLFRLGDFYELFFEDAETGAQLLNVALTRRGVVPMRGIPFHAATSYIARFLPTGTKAPNCDQLDAGRPRHVAPHNGTTIITPRLPS